MNVSDSIDTSSIIENKASTKEYWEKRMIAEQELISFDCDPNVQVMNAKIKSSTGQSLNCTQNQKVDKTCVVNGINGKLGSDGESEASPESSLSPVDVDSLEGSEGRQSPEGEASSEQSEISHREALRGISLSPCGDLINVDNDLFESDLGRELCLAFERNERKELTTVLEEEQEPDSLEEFIKHESECMLEDNINDILIPRENMREDIKEDKEVLYEEIISRSELDSETAFIEVSGLPNEATNDLIVIDNCINEPIMGSFISKPVNEKSDNEGEYSDDCRYSLNDNKMVNGVDTELNNNRNETLEEITLKDIANEPKPQIIGETLHNESLEESALTANTANTQHPVLMKATKSSRPANPAELKIASEIREFKEREEELRKMRDELKQKNFNCMQSAETPESKIEACSIESVSNSITANCNPSAAGRVTRDETILKNITDETIANNHKNLQQNEKRIKVKPLVDEESNDEPKEPKFKKMTESPIEREIRIAKEREEELRQAKLKLSSSHQNGENLTNGKIDGETYATLANKIPLFKQNSVGVINATDTQKLLATTRIQQEIEEQTQREIALRAIGSIQTLSQERTDANVSKLGDMEKNIGFNRLFNTNEQRERSETPQDLGQSAVPKLGSSTSSATSSANFPAVCRKVSAPSILGAKSVNMHKFINSKGKAAKTESLTFSPFASLNTNGICGIISNEYHELKPPQFTKGNASSLRRHVSAECKIQEELKEMKAREDELRKQRIRLIGLSQPSLNTLVDDENEDMPKISYPNKLFVRTTSIPNLINNEIKNEKNTTNDDGCQVGGPRRRIALIAQWEQKIQKEIKVKN